MISTKTMLVRLEELAKELYDATEALNDPDLRVRDAEEARENVLMARDAYDEYLHGELVVELHNYYETWGDFRDE